MEFNILKIDQNRKFLMSLMGSLVILLNEIKLKDNLNKPSFISNSIPLGKLIASVNWCLFPVSHFRYLA